jgi:hypothetical protein
MKRDQAGERNDAWKGGVPPAVCLYCGKGFRSYDVRRGGGKYCSKECKYNAVRGIVVSLVCDNCGVSFSRREYDALRRDTPGFFCSRKCASDYKQRVWAETGHPLAGIEFSEKHKRGIRMSTPRGSAHYRWAGGITTENHRERNSPEYVAWSKSVLERDKYTCQYCGVVGGTLHAHHVHSFAKYPTLRYYIENGITLCKKCHDKHHPGQYERQSSGGADLNNNDDFTHIGRGSRGPRLISFSMGEGG